MPQAPVCVSDVRLAPSRSTGKEHDNESGNDYFGARYYASSIGRWMSPDPSRLSAFIENPQSWNRYEYSNNNPLRWVDKNGLWFTSIHKEIIDQAFPGLSDAQRQVLKNISASEDNLLTGQFDITSFMHAMRAPGETVEQAKTDTIILFLGGKIQRWMLNSNSGEITPMLVLMRSVMTHFRILAFPCMR